MADRQQVGLFSRDVAQGIYSAFKATQSTDAGFGNAPGGGPSGTVKIHLFKLLANTSGTLWTAQKCGRTGSVPGDSLVEGIHVIGCPPKAGVVVEAWWDPITVAYIAISLPTRILDFGTGAQAPFVFEGGIMKLKTLTTTDGITWTEEKIEIPTVTC